MDFTSIWHLHSVQAVELRQKGIRILLNMMVIVLEDFAEEFVFGMVYGFYDVLVISREVEEAATFAWGSEFRQDVLACQRHEIVGRVKFEMGSQASEYPWCIIFEFEIILC